MVLSRKQKLALLLYLRKRRRSKVRLMSIHPINKLRNVCGEYHHLMPQLRQDEQKFKEYFRMDTSTFDYLLDTCSGELLKETTNFRKPITPEERLVVTLRFLATGESFHSLGFRFRMGVTTIRIIVNETVKVIWDKLQAIEMPIPDENKWTSIAENFFARCDFPLCLGAIDGKHIKIKAPPNSGSKYFNYKGHHSVVLIAVADADCKFTVVDVGAYGSNSDGGIFQDSAFYKLVLSKKLNIPQPSTIPGTDITVPFVFVADEAFPLSSNIMRPFPRRELTDDKRAFNYRLSRARRQVECAFGILSSMWRILLGTIEVHDAFACDIVKAVCVLHNMILNKEEERIPHIAMDDIEVQERTPTNAIPICNRRPANDAMIIRDRFMSYFVSPNGSLPWQNN